MKFVNVVVFKYKEMYFIDLNCNFSMFQQKNVLGYFCVVSKYNIGF